MVRLKLPHLLRARGLRRGARQARQRRCLRKVQRQALGQPSRRWVGKNIQHDQ
jgi:hypothetical protein